MLKLVKWLRFLAVVAIVGLLGFASVTQAHANTGNQNPDITIGLSASPGTVSHGQNLTVGASLVNNTTSALTLTLTISLTLNSHSIIHKTLNPFSFPAGKPFNKSTTIMVPNFLPKGTYVATASVTDQNTANGASTATAQVTIN